jgi:hypothetical protein
MFKLTYDYNLPLRRSVTRVTKRGLPAQDQRELPEFLCEKRPGGAGRHWAGTYSLQYPRITGVVG